ncbi:hypothetical protein CEP54_013725 [Fusarium duplospermum]|uniref:Uncharacterized protein n=1 Tax=Fusarium duplospermum TaxID=1325734 RepID=A0A428P126_9HYPO|nr:hypothetical protein CEP54_013725 [Fusarium duplospermum]
MAEYRCSYPISPQHSLLLPLLHDSLPLHSHPATDDKRRQATTRGTNQTKKRDATTERFIFSTVHIFAPIL